MDPGNRRRDRHDYGWQNNSTCRANPHVHSHSTAGFFHFDVLSPVLGLRARRPQGSVNRIVGTLAARQRIHFPRSSGDKGHNKGCAEIRCKIPRRSVQHGVKLDCCIGVVESVHTGNQPSDTCCQGIGSQGRLPLHAEPQ